MSKRINVEGIQGNRHFLNSRGEPIEVKMDDGSWVPGIGLQRGIEERQGQMYCAYHELRWWADLGEWRSVVRDTEQEPGMSSQEREALEEIEKMTSAIGGLSWSKAIGRLIAVRKRAQVALAAREDTDALSLLRLWFDARPLRRADNTLGKGLDAQTEALLRKHGKLGEDGAWTGRSLDQSCGTPNDRALR